MKSTIGKLAEKIQPKETLPHLGNSANISLFLVVLAEDAIKAALSDYRINQKKKLAQ